MMWQLHQTRHFLAKQNITASQIHDKAQQFIKKAGLTNLKVFHAK